MVYSLAFHSGVGRADTCDTARRVERMREVGTIMMIEICFRYGSNTLLSNKHARKPEDLTISCINIEYDQILYTCEILQSMSTAHI